MACRFDRSERAVLRTGEVDAQWPVSVGGGATTAVDRVFDAEFVQVHLQASRRSPFKRETFVRTARPGPFKLERARAPYQGRSSRAGVLRQIRPLVRNSSCWLAHRFWRVIERSISLVAPQLILARLRGVVIRQRAVGNHAFAHALGKLALAECGRGAYGLGRKDWGTCNEKAD